MKKLKSDALKTIVSCMDDLSINLQRTGDAEKIKANAEGLKALAEAFATISSAK